ncbi:MAG TPA: AAA family ATPase [Desulfobacterales bacterium]|jgi:predicted ATPase|nr:AAA family ATPase [Desulfobacterales bacterium]
MHLNKVEVFPERFPTSKWYPFNQPIFHKTRTIELDRPVTLFVGENGTGKSTLLEAICYKCGIHMWQGSERRRLEINPYEKELYKYISVDWTNGRVPGSFFGSDIFRAFAYSLDEWAATDPGQLKYFGGRSLVTQSHGQSLMSFFTARYQIKGLYLLDEPETALSPMSQLELVRLLMETSQAGHAQFIVATHSPILLGCPEGRIYSFDHTPVKQVVYEETEHYKIYRKFMEDPAKATLPLTHRE